MPKKALNTVSKFTLPRINIHKGKLSYITYLSDVLESNENDRYLMQEKKSAIDEAWIGTIRKAKSIFGTLWVQKKIAEVCIMAIYVRGCGLYLTCARWNFQDGKATGIILLSEKL